MTRDEMRFVLYALLALTLLGARLASTTTVTSGQSKQKQDELPTFTPTEKVPAGIAVSFPADI